MGIGVHGQLDDGVADCIIDTFLLISTILVVQSLSEKNAICTSAAADRSLKILEAGQIEEEDFLLCDTILHDIRKALENDMESAPDTTPADELIKEVRKTMQSIGDRVRGFL